MEPSLANISKFCDKSIECDSCNALASIFALPGLLSAFAIFATKGCRSLLSSWDQVYHLVQISSKQQVLLRLLGDRFFNKSNFTCTSFLSCVSVVGLLALPDCCCANAGFYTCFNFISAYVTIRPIVALTSIWILFKPCNLLFFIWD